MREVKSIYKAEENAFVCKRTNDIYRAFYLRMVGDALCQSFTRETILFARKSILTLYFYMLSVCSGSAAQVLLPWRVSQDSTCMSICLQISSFYCVFGFLFDFGLIL